MMTAVVPVFGFGILLNILLMWLAFNSLRKLPWITHLASHPSRNAATHPQILLTSQ
jgi:hypothetical protein